MISLICPWESPVYLFFSTNIPLLLPYSHFLALITALLSAFFLFKSRKEIFGKAFLLMSLLFILWVLIDWRVWATNQVDEVMFLWAIQILFELFIYATALYLMYDFVYNKKPKLIYQVIGSFILLPAVLLLPTRYFLAAADPTYCNAIEYPFIVYYSYIVETLCILLILRIITSKVVLHQIKERGPIIFLGLGIIIFLLSFNSGNIIGSLTEDWNIAQYGLFGMPLFVGFLTYRIVKFKTFNIKIFATQALVWALWIMTGSILFVVQSDAAIIITGITESIAVIFGVMLIRSVKREVEQRERLQKLTEELQAANEKLKELDKLKSEFLNFASHQVKSPMAVIKGFADLIASGAYGNLTDEAKEKAAKIKESADRTLALVGNLLDLGKIESGKMDFAYAQVDITKVVSGMVDDYKILGEKKGLAVSYEGSTSGVVIKADEQKIRQVIQNVIDNSIKYTKAGFVKIGLKEEGAKVLVTVTDSGQGISAELQKKLFGRFVRDEKTKNEIQGTGLGLYIAKEIVKAHNGEIWVESPGEGKGSTFNIRLSKE